MQTKIINTDSFSGPSFSFSNRFARWIWNIVYTLLFRYTPVPFHSWRSFLLRVFGASVGRGAHVYPSVKIWAPWNLDIGDQVGIGERVNLYCQAKIAIGNRAVISQQTFLCTGTHDYTSSGMKLICKPIIIGAYCWIAADVFVHPGITIGEGAVIGARSVVVKDMPEWMVCTGHPCVPIKQRIITDSSSK